jgi:hypothetical protein
MISVQWRWVSLSYATIDVAQVMLYSRLQATRAPWHAYSNPLASQSIQRTLYHIMWLGLGVSWKSVQLNPYLAYLLMGVSESVYTLRTFTVRLGRYSVCEIYIKWLKFVIQDIYKMVEIHYTRCAQMVEIPYTRCIQNGWNSLYKIYIKWLKLIIRDV